VLIRIWIERREPLAGTAAAGGSEPQRFDGWLELLGVASELVATGSSSEDADTTAIRTTGGTMPESIDTHRPNSAPAPSPELRRLGALVGRWRSEGHIVGEAPVPITGTDIYEWLPGGFFLLHHVDVMIGDQRVRALELIGEYDPATDSYTARAYDNLGSVTVMRARVDGQGVWRFTGGGDVASVARPASADAGGAVRSTLTVRPDRASMTAGWERSDDGASWQPWMDMTFTRMP
jgi:hypothetical protein